MKRTEKGILVINRSSSTCGDCGRGADPNEKSHKTIIEYSPDTGSKGCGAKWTKVSSDYSGKDNKRRTMEMRPDLEWVDWGF